MKTFYTIWIKHGDETTLKTDIDLIRTKRAAFALAKKLSKNLICNSGDAILVRHITIGSNVCTEWVFSPDD